MNRVSKGFFRLSLPQWVLWLAVVAVVFQPVLVGDLYGYLVYGDWMLENQAITTVDVFSFTVEGTAWVNHEWFFQVVLTGVKQLFGWTGLLVLQLGLTAAIVLLIMVFCRSPDTNLIQWALNVSLPVLAVVPGLTLRPQLLTYLAILILGVVFYDIRRFQGSDYLILAGLFAVWSNVHGGVLVGMVFLCFLLFRQVVLEPGLMRGLKAITLTITAMAFTVLNPYGLELWTMVSETAGDPVTSVFIQEWRPTWLYPFHLSVWCLLGGQWILSLVQSHGKMKRRVWLVIICLTGAALLSLWPRRNLTYYGLAVAMFGVPVQVNWLESVEIPDLIRRGVLTGAGMGAILVIGMTIWNGFYTTERHYPERLINQLNVSDRRTNLYVHYPWAQWAIYSRPNLKVFLDGRWKTVYSDDVIKDYGKILLGDMNSLRRYDLDWVLIPGRYGLNAELNRTPGWTLLAKHRKTYLWKQTGRESSHE
ncbi:MAG: hypothetical protein ABEK50_13835 [bacterium]